MADVLYFKEATSQEIYRIRQGGQLLQRAPGTYEVLINAANNSLLSTLYVHELDPGASVKINYYDFTQAQDLGERFDLVSHSEADTAPSISRISVTNIHNKVIAEAIVTGGNATFGLYGTTVSTFATDLDAALRSHNEQVQIDRHKGLPQVYWDTVLNEWQFVEGSGGALKLAEATGKTNPASRRFELTNANQEYAVALREKLVGLTIQNFESAVVKCSWQAGESGTNYFVIPPGGVYNENAIVQQDLTIYVQSNKPNTQLAFIEWI